MNHLSFLVAVSIVFACCVNNGQAIQCYVCKSHEDPRCEHDLVPEMLTNCTVNKLTGQKYTACRKIDQYIDEEYNGLPASKRIIRQCAELTDGRACYYQAGLKTRINVCHCYNDQCNTASVEHISSLALSVVGVIAIVTHYLR